MALVGQPVTQHGEKVCLIELICICQVRGSACLHDGSPISLTGIGLLQHCLKPQNSITGSILTCTDGI